MLRFFILLSTLENEKLNCICYERESVKMIVFTRVTVIQCR